MENTLTPTIEIGSELYIKPTSKWKKITIVRETLNFWVDNNGKKFYKDLRTYDLYSNTDTRYYLQHYGSSGENAWVPYPSLLDGIKKDELTASIKQSLIQLERLNTTKITSVEDLEIISLRLQNLCEKFNLS